MDWSLKGASNQCRRAAIILLSLAMIPISSAMTTPPDKKFRFEDYVDRVHEKERGKYKTTKEGLEDLKRLHPFGSELVPLLQTLAEAGATCGLSSDKYRGTQHVLCFYRKGAGGFWGWLGIVVQDWRVAVEYDREREPLDTEMKGKVQTVKLDSPANMQRKIVSYTFSWGMDGP